MDFSDDLVVWLEEIRLSTKPVLHARLSDVEAAIVRLELRIEELEIRMSEAESAIFQRIADMIGVIKAEFASLKQQLDAAMVDKAAAVEAALGEDAMADATRLEGLLAELSTVVTQAPEIPAEVPDVEVPEPGEPAEEPHPDNTLPGDLPPE